METNRKLEEIIEEKKREVEELVEEYKEREKIKNLIGRALNYFGYDFLSALLAHKFTKKFNVEPDYLDMFDFSAVKTIPLKEHKELVEELIPKGWVDDKRRLLSEILLDYAISLEAFLSKDSSGEDEVEIELDDDLDSIAEKMGLNIKYKIRLFNQKELEEEIKKIRGGDLKELEEELKKQIEVLLGEKKEA